MELKTEIELASTREKLHILEQRYEQSKTEPTTDEELRRISLRSLKRIINQLKEEIARYEAHHPA